MIVVDAQFRDVFDTLTDFGIAVDRAAKREELASRLIGGDLPDVPGVTVEKVEIRDLHDYLDYWMTRPDLGVESRRKMAAGGLWDGSWLQNIRDVRRSDGFAVGCGYREVERDIEPGAKDRVECHDLIASFEKADPDFARERRKRIVRAIVRCDKRSLSEAAMAAGVSETVAAELLDESDRDVEQERRELRGEVAGD